MLSPVIHVACPDSDHPWGGIRQIYRHVDRVNALGWRANVLHWQPGFRCTWFEHRTAIRYAPERPVGDGDVLVVPEVMWQQFQAPLPGIRRVVLSQGPYLTFRPEAAPDAVPTEYRQPDVLGAIVVSADSARYLTYAFPGLTVHRVRHAVDAERFQPRGDKRRQIAYMPRRRPEDARQVLGILRTRGALAGWDVMPIDGLNEQAVAKTLQESAIFLHFGQQEGFGLPAVEAMACECAVIGYPAGGGAEFLTAETGFPIVSDDILGFAQAVEAVIATFHTTPERLQELGRRARTFVLDRYNERQAQDDVRTAWTALVGPPA
jgi:hypothetical protein